jgi:hypothetical protein
MCSDISGYAIIHFDGAHLRPMAASLPAILMAHLALARSS